MLEITIEWHAGGSGSTGGDAESVAINAQARVVKQPLALNSSGAGVGFRSFEQLRRFICADGNHKMSESHGDPVLFCYRGGR